MRGNAQKANTDRQKRQRLLNRRQMRFVLMAVGAILGVLLLDLALITLYADQQREQFEENAKPFKALLVSSADAYIKQGDIAGLKDTLQNNVLGDLLYGQIVVDGQVLAERFAPKVGRATLPIESLAPNTHEQTILRRLPSGESYLDVRLNLTPLMTSRNGEIASYDPTTTYVRFGYSMISVDLAIGRYALDIVRTSGLLLLAIGLLFWFMTWLSTRAPREESQTQPAVAQEITPLREAGESLAVDISTNGTGATKAPTSRVLQLRAGALVLDEECKRIYFEGQVIALSPKEYKLFIQLASNPARIFSDEEIIHEVWGTESFATSKDVKQYVYFLRRKLRDNAEAPKFIETVRGHGYKLAI